MTVTRSVLFFGFLGFVVPSAPAHAGTISVPSGSPSITAALVVASPGDVIEVAPGTYSAGSGEIFPLVIAADVTVIGGGAGASTIQGDGTASLFEITAPAGARISAFTLTGGQDLRGGAIHVMTGSPEIDHNLITGNGALNAGSGIHCTGGSAPWIHHNVVWQNFDIDFDDPGDPHGVQILVSDALVEHNLVGRTDSNGIIVHGDSTPTIRNNILFENGIEGVRGRGICHFGQPATVIAHNLFHGNVIAAILISGATGDVSGAAANDVDPEDGLYGNRDGDPMFVDDDSDWQLTLGSPAIDTGDPGSPLDPDGTVADIGPFFFDQSPVGIADSESPTATGLVGVLMPAAPNPFRATTTMQLVIDQPATVRIRVFDAAGRFVRLVDDGQRAAGAFAATWDGRYESGARAPAGIYFVRLELGGVVSSQKLVLSP